MKALPLILATMLFATNVFATTSAQVKNVIVGGNTESWGEAQSNTEPFTNKTNVVIYHDPNQESNRFGFFDREARTPTKSNPGETVGEARQYVLEYAAKMIESQFFSDARINFGASFNNGVYLSASTTTFSYKHTEYDNYDDFGILKDGVYYPVVLKRVLQGKDTEGSRNNTDADMAFRDYDAGYDIDELSHTRFLSLVLHEMVHGLGFANNLCYREDCSTEELDKLTAMGDHIFVESPYNDSWYNLDGTQRHAAAKEDDKIFYRGNEALKNYIANEVTGNGSNLNGIMLHSGLTDNGDLDSQTMSHISPLVDNTELMKSRVGNTTDLGATAYILCNMGWCRDTGFVTDFGMSIQETPRLKANEIFDLTYVIKNPDERTIQNVFIDIEFYDASLIAGDLPSNCTLDTTLVTCSIGNLEFNVEKSISLPFSAANDGTYRVMANTYSKSYIIDRDGFDNVNVQVITVGEIPFPTITMTESFSMEEESVFDMAPTFEANSDLTFTWAVTDSTGLNFSFTENASTGKLEMTLPAVEQDTTAMFKLTAHFDDREQEFDVSITITAKVDDDTGDDGSDDGSDSDTGGTNTGGNTNTGNNSNTGNNTEAESGKSGGSMGIFSALILGLVGLRRFKSVK